MTHRLIALSYSPWSEKARWALDHHGIPFVEQAYSPLFGEWLLRWQTGLRERPLTVPILRTPTGAIQDSLRIARYAEAQGKGSPLFADVPAVEEWNALSERLLRHGRALLLKRLEQHPDAIIESMPAMIPGFLHRPLRPMFQATGMWFFRSKYKIDRDEGLHRQALVEGFEQLHLHLKAGRTYILDRFSFADIAMAASLQMVQPVEERFLSIGAATREAWREPELAKRFDDLLAWRDGIYQMHRHK